MASVLNRTLPIYRQSVNTPDFPVAEWHINPDVSAVLHLPVQYWKRDGDNPVLPMSQAEMDALNAAAKTVRDDNAVTNQDNETIRALLAAINALETNAGLRNTTIDVIQTNAKSRM